MQGIVERALLHEVSPLCYHLLSLQHCSKRLRGREGGREGERKGGRERDMFNTVSSQVVQIYVSVVVTEATPIT